MNSWIDDGWVFFHTAAPFLLATNLLKMNSFLTHSFPVHPFSTSWKHQKTLRFLMFSEGRERVHWEQMGKSISDQSPHFIFPENTRNHNQNLIVLTLSRRRPNQWTGIYVITASVLKGLIGYQSVFWQSSPCFHQVIIFLAIPNVLYRQSFFCFVFLFVFFLFLLFSQLLIFCRWSEDKFKIW